MLQQDLSVGVAKVIEVKIAHRGEGACLQRANSVGQNGAVLDGGQIGCREAVAAVAEVEACLRCRNELLFTYWD